MLCFPMPISSLPSANPLLLEHKIEVFVRFCPQKPSFSGLLSTKSGVFVRFYPSKPSFSGISSTKSGFLYSRWDDSLKFGVGAPTVCASPPSGRFSPPEPVPTLGPVRGMGPTSEAKWEGWSEAEGLRRESSRPPGGRANRRSAEEQPSARRKCCRLSGQGCRLAGCGPECGPGCGPGCRPGCGPECGPGCESGCGPAGASRK